jgi:metacaspase-1
MEKEILNIEDQYQNVINRLVKHTNYIITIIKRKNYPYNFEKGYIKSVHKWFFSVKKRYDKTRSILLENISEKYNVIHDSNAEPIGSMNGKKKACLIGINYVGTNYVLNGCVNDVLKLRYMFMNEYNFSPEDIRLITNQYATRDTILREFTDLVQNANTGDTIFFTFSGHGTYIKDENKEEIDGRDEVIVSSDFRGIVDDELKEIVNKHLKKGVQMFVLFDNCHSGTMLDLRYQLEDGPRPRLKINNSYKETSGSVICLSGCRDNQYSVDAYIEQKYNGAMTWALVEALKSNKNGSWINVLKKVKQLLKNRQFTQVPQMTFGTNFNYNKSVFEW